MANPNTSSANKNGDKSKQPPPAVMASTTKPTTPAPKPEEKNDDSEGLGLQEEKVKLSTAEVKKLFETYEVAKVDADKAETELKDANAAKSKAVEQIAEDVGKGPFRWKGRELSIMKRGETYFFKGEAEKKKAMEIE